MGPEQMDALARGAVAYSERLDALEKRFADSGTSDVKAYVLKALQSEKFDDLRVTRYGDRIAIVGDGGTPIGPLFDDRSSAEQTLSKARDQARKQHWR